MASSNTWEDLKSSFENLKQSIALIRECDDCTRGPCVGRLLREDVGWTVPAALYIVGSQIYAKRCSMLMKKPKMAVRLERDEYEVVAYYPICIPIQEEVEAGAGDVLVDHLMFV